MTNHLNGPTVLITGALTGIGRATALAFAREGARVVVSGRHNDEGQKLTAELRKLGTEAEFVRTGGMIAGWGLQLASESSHEYTRERDLLMPIIEINEKLTRVIRGRSIQLVMQEEGLVTIVFDDYSTMRVKVAGGPTIDTLAESKIESVGESGADLTLVGEDCGTATLRLAEAGSSVMVKDENGQVEYAG
jgi:short chain dehydrogenase